MQFVLRHERQNTLRFAALESDVGRRIRERHPELKSVDSMIWVDHADEAAEAVVIRSDAGMKIAHYLGGPWRLAAIGRVVPRFLRDTAYDFIARHRHRLATAADHCYIPPPAVRQRFMDQPFRTRS